jgi:hypothetical protein
MIRVIKQVSRIFNWFQVNLDQKREFRERVFQYRQDKRRAIKNKVFNNWM